MNIILVLVNVKNNMINPSFTVYFVNPKCFLERVAALAHHSGDIYSLIVVL